MSSLAAEEDQDGWEEEEDNTSSAMLRYITDVKNTNLDPSISMRSMRDEFRKNKRFKQMHDADYVEKMWLKVEMAALGNKKSATVRLPRGIQEDWLKQSPGAFSVEEIEGKGVGMVAARDIEPGSTLLVAYPLAAYFEGEDDENDEEDDDDDDDDDGDNPFRVDDSTAKLVIALVPNILKDEDVRGSIADLWPRKLSELPSGTPKIDQWKCDSKVISSALTAALMKLAACEKKLQIKGKLALRLPELVRSNALGMDTSPELLCHPNPPTSGGMTRLSGIGLYHLPSFFNHSCKPNVARYHLGGLAVFRTNQLVRTGEELNISYIEHDLLGESIQVRRMALADQRKDFSLPDDDSVSTKSQVKEEKDARLRPCVGIDYQNALAELSPAERLEEIKDLFSQDSSKLLDVDRKELLIQQAVAHAQCGDAGAAWLCWQQVISFVLSKLPPNDESLPVFLIQAAVCLMAMDKSEEAMSFIAKAVRSHDVAFGGGPYFMALRYQTELLRAPLFKKAAIRVWGMIAAMAGDRFRRYD